MSNTRRSRETNRISRTPSKPKISLANLSKSSSSNLTDHMNLIEPTERVSARAAVKVGRKYSNMRAEDNAVRRASVQILNTESIESEDERKKKILATISELVSTEKSYLQDLETMIEKIMKPMGNKRDFLTGNPLVTQQQMNDIWSNICLLPPVNQALYDAFCKANEFSEELQLKEIANAFLGVADYMKIYTTFCSNQPISTETVQNLMIISQFEAFLAERADVCIVEESHNLDLNAFLIKPVQRICKYPLFLRDLLRHTPVHHDAFDSLEKAAMTIENVVRSINDAKKKAENNHLLASISQKISKLPSDFSILEPGRTFHRQEDFKRLTVKKKSFKGTVFLFSDVILFGKAKRKGKVSYVSHFPVQYITLTSNAEGLEIKSEGRSSFTILAESQKQREQWIGSIQQVSLSKKKQLKLFRSTC